MTSRLPPRQEGRPRPANHRQLPAAASRRPVRTSRHRPEPASGGRRGLLLALLALVCGGLGVVGWKLSQTNQPPPPAASPPSPFPAQFQAARQLIAEGRIAQGHQALLDLQAAAPDFEPEVVTTYIDRSQGELANEKALEMAAQAVEGKQVAQAVSALAQVTSTIQKDKKRDIEKRLALVVEEKATAARAMKGAGSTAKEMQKLESLSGDALAALPDDLELRRLHDRAVSVLAALKLGPRPAAAPSTGSPLAAVTAAYRSGDLSEALANAQLCAASDDDCRDAVAVLKEQQSRLARVDGLSSAEQRAVLRADRQLAGGQRTSLVQSVRRRLAGDLVLEASRQAAAKSWKRATLLGREALEVDADSAEAKRIIETAASAVQERFRQCYVAKDNQVDEAIVLCKEVLEMAPPDDSSYQRAVKLLETLKR